MHESEETEQRAPAPTQSNASDHSLASTSTYAEVSNASDKESLTQKDVGYKDPGISETNETCKIDLKKVAEKELGSQQQDSELVSRCGKSTEKPLANEQRALESGVVGLSLFAAPQLTAVEKTVEKNDLVSVKDSQLEPLFTTLHSDHGHAKEVTVEPPEPVLTELPVNPFEDLQTELGKVVHDYDITVDSSTVAQDGPQPALVNVAGETQVNEFSKESIKGELVREETGPPPLVTDIGSQDLIAKPAGQVNETVMGDNECLNMETNGISITTEEYNETIVTSPQVTFSETMPPKDQVVTSQPAEASTPVEKMRVQHRKIYREQTYTKELVESSPFKPLTIQQLESLYYNPQLAQNDKFVQEFVQVKSCL